MRRYFTLGCALLMAGFGGAALPTTADAQIRAKFNSGNFKGGYSSFGGFRGFYNGGNVKVGVRLGGGYYGRGGYYGGGYGYYGRGFYGRGRYFPRRFYGYGYPYAFFGPRVFSIDYGAYEPVSYLPTALQQPASPPASTTTENVSNSPGSIIINSEKTIIYQNAAPAASTSQTPAASLAAAPANPGGNTIILTNAQEAVPTTFPADPAPAVSTASTDPPITYRYAPGF
ncbi:MAG: hypothetical protein AAGK14_08440 [Verrucomicrobiota bacterium]